MPLINEVEHFINRVNENQLDEIDVSLNIVIKDQNAESIYTSKEMVISEPLETFLKRHIFNELLDLKVDGNYLLSQYNNELQINDTISYYNYSIQNDEDIIKSRISSLNEAITADLLQQGERCKFQIVRLDVNENSIYFCFYKGIKKNSRKRKLALFNPGELTEIQQRIIEIGGPLAFFYDNEYIYIIRVREFEYALNYTDHITQKSAENLAFICNLGIFIDDEAKENFCDQANATFHLRGLANMKEDTLQNLQSYYNDRVNELEEISNTINSLDGNQREAYLEEIGDLFNLIEYFNFQEKKIIFEDEDSPTVLLHFFQDKIMKSFLTQRIRAVVG